VNAPTSLSPSQLPEFLLHVALVRPVFIWGPPGIGKSALVQKFADSLGFPCVSLLGSQLAPEDLIGVPQIINGKSRFCPPTTIARDEPYCLFLDELNACSHEVQKAFYSLIHDRKLGEYELPRGSIVIGAGNRAQDAAIVKPMSSALLNRMIHVHLQASAKDWMAWARESGVHPLVIDYLSTRPDHLWHAPPKHEEPFSTPRAWHMLSDALWAFGGDDAEKLPDSQTLDALVFGCLTPSHATQWKAFLKQVRSKYALDGILKGETKWPASVDERDVLYFLAQSFRARLIKELPPDKAKLGGKASDLAFIAKGLLKDLSHISLEIAQVAVASDETGSLPGWFIAEIVRDLPRLVRK
jgi:hypothetical protein